MSAGSTGWERVEQVPAAPAAGQQPSEGSPPAETPSVATPSAETPTAEAQPAEKKQPPPKSSRPGRRERQALALRGGGSAKPGHGDETQDLEAAQAISVQSTLNTVLQKLEDLVSRVRSPRQSGPPGSGLSTPLLEGNSGINRITHPDKSVDAGHEEVSKSNHQHPRQTGQDQLSKLFDDVNSVIKEQGMKHDQGMKDMEQKHEKDMKEMQHKYDIDKRNRCWESFCLAIILCGAFCWLWCLQWAKDSDASSLASFNNRFDQLQYTYATQDSLADLHEQINHMARTQQKHEDQNSGASKIFFTRDAAGQMEDKIEDKLQELSTAVDNFKLHVQNTVSDLKNTVDNAQHGLTSVSKHAHDALTMAKDLQKTVHNAQDGWASASTDAHHALTMAKTASAILHKSCFIKSRHHDCPDHTTEVDLWHWWTPDDYDPFCGGRADPGYQDTADEADGRCVKSATGRTAYLSGCCLNI